MSEAATAQPAGKLPKQVFIVYQKHEETLAEAIKQLFEYWGIGTFYCRQKIRGAGVSEPYRRFLAEELSAARLVIPLLSPSFEWSKYCQAEAGAAATLKLPMVAVIIPPSTEENVKSISPVLEGFDFVVVAPETAGWGADKLVHYIRFGDHSDKWSAQRFIDQLRSATLQALNLDPLNVKVQDDHEIRLREGVAQTLRWVIEDNLLSRPKKEVLSIWPSISNAVESFAPASIIENVKRSLTDATIPTTELDLAGVSLKFSLHMITAALTSLADEHPADLGPASSARNSRKKRLQITLVHMDEMSNILHALHDQVDIRNIVRSFHKHWPETLTAWKDACDTMGVELLPPILHCIDYIPPRIGIMIDRSVLYAGRCSFPRKGFVEFTLRAGENEYFFYDRESERGRKEIAEFEEYLDVYSKPVSGIVIIPGGHEWIASLEECVASYPNIKEITLISQTCTKFLPLIGLALTRGMVVKIYVQRPDKAPAEARPSIENLERRIRKLVERRSDCPLGGGADIYYYEHLPTYRAAVIGDDILGIQLYVPHPPEPGTLNPGELRLMVSKHSAKYADLKRELIDQFRTSPGVSRQPDLPRIVATSP